MKENLKIAKTEEGVKFGIRIIPNASKCEITGIINNELKLKLDVPPVDGKANEKCVKLLSKILGMPKTSIFITSGEKSRSKTILIKGKADDLELNLKQIFLKNL